MEVVYISDAQDIFIRIRSIKGLHNPSKHFPFITGERYERIMRQATRISIVIDPLGFQPFMVKVVSKSKVYPLIYQQTSSGVKLLNQATSIDAVLGVKELFIPDLKPIPMEILFDIAILAMTTAPDSFRIMFQHNIDAIATGNKTPQLAIEMNRRHEMIRQIHLPAPEEVLYRQRMLEYGNEITPELQQEFREERDKKTALRLGN